VTGRPVTRKLTAVAAALWLLSATAGSLLAATPDPTISPAWPIDTALAYRWATGAVPPSIMMTAINAAAADATASRGSHAPSYAYSSTAPNSISYGTSNPCGVNGLACFSRNPASAYWQLWFRENGHRYDWGTLAWCEMTGSPNGCYRAETITIDELGHVAGLDHHVNLPDGSDYADAVVQAYSRTRPQVGWNAGVFGRCDVATLQQVYDVASWTTLYSTCLDVPTSLALAVSSTTAKLGTAVTFTATLKSAGGGRLAGNPMAGRIVVLQALTGTTWVDVATMPVGSTQGTYRTAWAPSRTQSFRAVFRKPVTEGVRASTSPSLTVVVACYTSPCQQLASPAGSGRLGLAQ
jgi:hypothetical protein